MNDALVLAIDTATRWPVVALAGRDGSLVGTRQWESRHRHGEQLLEQLDDLLASAGHRPSDLGAIVVGVGPGSFTGLRIGLATAKVLAYSLDIPLVGIPTTHALALAAAGESRSRVDIAVSLPAGATDRYVARVRVEGGSVYEPQPPALVAGPADFASATRDSRLVAVDIEAPEVPAEALERGRRAVEGLGPALMTLGTAALDAGRVDDVAALVPAYVALPRGVQQTAEEMVWSPDLR